MTVKKIFILVYTLLSLFSLSARQEELDIKLTNWEILESYETETHIKTVKETSIIIPENFEKSILYLNAERHSGYSRIFINNTLFSEVGSITHINSGDIDSNYLLPIPVNVRQRWSINRIRIENYKIKDNRNPIYSIKSNKNQGFLRAVDQRSRTAFPFTLAFATLIFLFIYLKYKDRDSDRIFLPHSLAFFTIYFCLSGLGTDNIITEKIYYFSQFFAVIGWISFLLSHIIRHGIWALKRIYLVTAITIVIILSIIIVYRSNLNSQNSHMLFIVIISVLNALYLLVVFSNEKHSDLTIRIGAALGLLFHTVTFIQYSINQLDLSFITQLGFIVVETAFMIDFLNSINQKINNAEIYNNKLLDSFDKLKGDLEKKDKEISDLKNKNDEVVREKSLFFSTLSSNLRAPLNSIIGYSENLYSLDDIKEVHSIVSEIIIESDKIFQSINNIMDFSSRNFTNSDLQLRTFRMKEIYENSVYGSSIISSYKTQITYSSKDNSDKVLIYGNPIIYKQITTSALHYLIGLTPQTMEFIISNEGITKEYMNLVVTMKASDIVLSDYEEISSLDNSKEIFSKYVKLYSIDYKEAVTDNDIMVEFKFQCGLANHMEKKTEEKKPNDLILKRNLSVLAVEDYQPNLNIVKLHLTKMGCEVYTATNGDEAINIFKRENIDVILMDIKMPVMDGWQATEHIRSTEKGLDTLIIGLTASSLDLDIRHCFESGMDDVQVKPIRKNQLFHKLSGFDNFQPVQFPDLSSLRADYGISKVETETLFSSSINQIEKQLEVIEILSSAHDDKGLEKEMPAIIHAALTINAFYYTRLIRNYYNAYNSKEKERCDRLLMDMKTIIQEVKEQNEELFRD